MNGTLETRKNSVDFSKAFCVTLDARWSLPTQAGIYVVRKGDLVLYVGITKNFRYRWYSHHITPKVRKYGRDGEIEICCFSMPHNEAWWNEKPFIEALRPVLNVSPRRYGYREIH